MKNGAEKCVCKEYRRLGAVTRQTTYPMTTCDSSIDSVAAQAKCSWFAFRDLDTGYFQLKMAPEDVYKTAIQVKRLGTVAFSSLSMGCRGSASFMQRVIEVALRHLLLEAAIAYRDDLICYTANPNFTQKVGAYFGPFSSSKTKDTPCNKSHLSIRRVRFIGHIFYENGISVQDSKFDIVRK